MDEHFRNLKYNCTETYKNSTLVSGMSTDSSPKTSSYIEPRLGPKSIKGIEYFWFPSAPKIRVAENMSHSTNHSNHIFH